MEGTWEVHCQHCGRGWDLGPMPYAEAKKILNAHKAEGAVHKSWMRPTPVREKTRAELMTESQGRIAAERGALGSLGAESHVLAYLSMAEIALGQQVMNEEDPGSVGC